MPFAYSPFPLGRGASRAVGWVSRSAGFQPASGQDGRPPRRGGAVSCPPDSRSPPNRQARSPPGERKYVLKGQPSVVAPSPAGPVPLGKVPSTSWEGRAREGGGAPPTEGKRDVKLSQDSRAGKACHCPFSILAALADMRRALYSPVGYAQLSRPSRF